MHIFAYTQFQAFANLTDEIQFPPGYINAIRFCLAERLMPMYGKANQLMMAKIESPGSPGQGYDQTDQYAPAPSFALSRPTVVGQIEGCGAGSWMGDSANA